MHPKHKVGEVHYYSLDDKAHWKLDLYGGNMMCAFIYHFKEDGKPMYRFFTFLNDIGHAERILKNDKDFFKVMAIGNHKFRKFKLKISSKEYKYSNEEMIKFAKLLVKLGYKVELY